MKLGTWSELEDGRIVLYGLDGCTKVIVPMPDTAALTSAVLRRNGGGTAVTVTDAVRRLGLERGEEVRVAIWKND